MSDCRIQRLISQNEECLYQRQHYLKITQTVIKPQLFKGCYQVAQREKKSGCGKECQKDRYVLNWTKTGGNKWISDELG